VYVCVCVCACLFLFGKPLQVRRKVADPLAPGGTDAVVDATLVPLMIGEQPAPAQHHPSRIAEAMSQWKDSILISARVLTERAAVLTCNSQRVHLWRS
jgi:hypothetical protein